MPRREGRYEPPLREARVCRSDPRFRDENRGREGEPARPPDRVSPLRTWRWVTANIRDAPSTAGMLHRDRARSRPEGIARDPRAREPNAWRRNAPRARPSPRTALLRRAHIDLAWETSCRGRALRWGSLRAPAPIPT